MLLVALGLLFIVYLRYHFQWRSRTRGRPLPPGPSALPVVGSVFDFPKVRPWVGLRDFCNKYGDIIYMSSLNQHHVVLGSTSAVSEFLDKHTANTSDRLVTATVDLLNADWVLGLMPYGQRWRYYRRALWQHFNPGAISRYQPVQVAISRLLLTRLLQDPLNFKQHISFTFSASILKIAYGIDVEDANNELIQRVETVLDGVSQTMVPGKFVVDHVPILKHLPSWFPGGGFHKVFQEWKDESLSFKDFVFTSRNTALTEKIVSPYIDSIIDIMLSNTRSSQTFSEELIKDVAAIALEAGADTTIATLQATILALSLYPEVQKKAQAELDAVVGPKRLPSFDDRASLVYINALMKESFRWFTVTPLGISHRTLVDDEFRGYFIPAGTVLTANIWACMHDPETFEDPDEFRPERFIRDGKLDLSICDPSAFIFGSGRRICPGRYFAEASLFLNIASILHVFDITPPLTKTASLSRLKWQCSRKIVAVPSGLAPRMQPP
uniref:N/A n=1 Tax=Ganoderma boninense TaxID=34458 RepID=A0A5K1JYA0_9APHY|nr:N/A [Ganoderma boninense]